MNAPALSTIKRLFAMSGNRCAFPSCQMPIVEDSGTVTGIVCHIKARKNGGPRYDKMQTAEERHSFENLILMCGRHSKLIDSEPKTYSAEFLADLKKKHERNGYIELSRSDVMKAEALLKDYCALYITAGGHVMLNSPGAVQGTNITVKTERKKIKIMPAEGTIGSDAIRRNYVKHLIDRYNEFASQQPGRVGFSFAAIYSHLKKKFKADWERIPSSRFYDVVLVLQNRINKTRLGCINRGKGIHNYSDFEDYKRDYAGG